MPKGIPRGAPLPNLSLGELIDAAMERKRKRDEEEGVATCSQSQPTLATSTTSGSPTSQVVLMKARSRCSYSSSSSLQLVPSSHDSSFSSPCSSTTQLMVAKPKVKAGVKARKDVPPVNPIDEGRQVNGDGGCWRPGAPRGHHDGL